jgi:hypothetical protein
VSLTILRWLRIAAVAGALIGLAGNAKVPAPGRADAPPSGGVAVASATRASNAPALVGTTARLAPAPPSATTHASAALAAAAPARASTVSRSNTAGLSIVVLDNGVPAADVAAGALVDQVLGSLGSGPRGRLRSMTIRLDVIPVGSELTDLPDFSFLRGVSTFDGRSYSSLRGVGPTVNGDTVSFAVGAEQVVPSGTTPYGPGYAVSHESGHIVRHLALNAGESAALKNIYAHHPAGAPWLTSYSATNDDEYFADSTAAWFGHPWSVQTTTRFTRSWVVAHDPAMAALLRGVYALG